MKFFTFFTLLLFPLVSARPSLRQLRQGQTPQNNTNAENPSSTPIDTPANVTITPCFTEPSSTPSPIPSSGAGSTNSSSAQSSLALLPSLIATNFAKNGLNVNTSESGEVASLTSTNNFINWCATLPHLPITNGQQLINGSCNPAPIGVIPSSSNMPSVKFVEPHNFALVPPNTTFQIILAVRNLATGYFANSDTNYLAAPQELDPTTGLIQGHAHVVIEALHSLNQTTPTDPTKFAFFAALNSKADAKDYLYANVTGGLPMGVYKLSSITTAKNHQPVFLPIAQRGTSEDAIYFTVGKAGHSTNATAPTAHPSHPTSPHSALSVPIPTQTASTRNETEPC